MLKTFEISKRKNKTGRRMFKIILHEIYPDECIDTVNEQGTLFNLNGITWIREYCERAMDTIKDTSLRVEFLDEERTEICGHGDTGVEDGLPIFENADVIGHFTKGYIDTITDDAGEQHTVMMGEGYIDEMCYKNFVTKLESDIANGNAPFGSVEIYQTESNDGIQYLYGYKPEGRIPTEFMYSGYALLGVRPADNQARIIELNNDDKGDICKMNADEIKALIEQTVNELSNHVAEINECRQECENRINEAAAAMEAVVNEKNEIEANSQQIQAALDTLKAEYEALNDKYNTLWDEKRVLEKALAEAKARERIAELSTAISRFTDEQRDYAREEIDAFKADPVNSEINTVVDKILRVIGMNAVEAAAAEEARIASEQNSANTHNIDIFGDVAVTVASNVEDTNIF